MHNEGFLRPEGSLKTQVFRNGIPVVPLKPLSVESIMEYGTPHINLSDEVNRWRIRNQSNLWRGLPDVLRALKSNLIAPIGSLYIKKITANGEEFDYGLASLRVVTTAFVNRVTDSMQNQTANPIDVFNFHGIGTGAAAEAVGDTALQTELTTEYNPDNTRATGTKAEGASPNIYQTVGTNTVDAAAAITEHGIFTQAATGGGVLCDRSVFSVINLANGDSLQTTYELTWTAGG